VERCETLIVATRNPLNVRVFTRDPLSPGFKVFFDRVNNAFKKLTLVALHGVEGIILELIHEYGQRVRRPVVQLVSTEWHGSSQQVIPGDHRDDSQVSADGSGHQERVKELILLE
jgi:hypothetical protein